MSDFNIDNKYNEKSGFDRIIIGAQSPLLEVELNELQLIQNKKIETALKNSVGNCISNKTLVSYTDGVFSIENGATIICEGHIIKVGTGGVKLTIESGSIYLNVYEEVATYSSQLKEYGNMQSTIPVVNEIMDSRLNIETSRRILRKYTLSKTTDVNAIISYKIADVINGIMNLYLPQQTGISEISNILFGKTEDSGTSIYINNGLDTSVLDISVNGKTFQRTATGKNRLNYNKITDMSDNGIMLKLRPGGSFYFYGERSIVSNPCSFMYTLTTAETLEMFDSVDDYCLSGMNQILNSGKVPTFVLELYYDGVKKATYNSIDSKIINITSTIRSKNDLYVKIGFYIDANTQIALGEYTVQLEHGIVPTSYEYFSNGMYSPNTLSNTNFKDDLIITDMRNNEYLVNMDYFEINVVNNNLFFTSFFSEEDGPYESNGITLTPNEDGTFSFSGTRESIDEDIIFETWIDAPYLFKTSGRYYLCGMNPLSVPCLFVNIKDGTDNVLLYSSDSYTSSEPYFDITDDLLKLSDVSISLGFKIPKNVTFTTDPNILYTPMICFETKETEFKQSKRNSIIMNLSQNGMRSIDAVHDVLENKDNTYGITRNIGKTIFIGTENWILESTLLDVNVFSLTDSTLINSLSDNSKLGMCDYSYYLYDPTNQLNKEHFYITENTIRIFVSKMTATTLDEFKNFMKIHNMTVHYVLKNSYFEQLDYEHQRKLNNLKTFIGKNRINVLWDSCYERRMSIDTWGTWCTSPELRISYLTNSGGILFDILKKIDYLSENCVKATDIGVFVDCDNWYHDSGIGYYVNGIYVQGITADTNPHYDIFPFDGMLLSEKEQIIYNSIETLMTSEDYITILSKTKPDISFVLMLKDDLGTGDNVISNYATMISKMNELENKILLSNKNVYVSPTGSDTFGDGSNLNPYKTITKAFNTIPKILNGYEPYIYLEEGTYNENLMIDGFGNERIFLVIPSNKQVILNGSINIYKSYIQINSSSTSNGILTINENEEVPLRCGFNSNLYFQNVELFINANVLYDGIKIREFSNIGTNRDITINNSSTAIHLVIDSTLSGVNLRGTGNNLKIYSGYGSVVTFENNLISANLETITAYGGSINSLMSYIPTATNLGTITTHLAMVKNGVARYKLFAMCGTWVANTPYMITTLDSIYRPVSRIEKSIVLRNGVQAYLYIGVDGLVQITPWTNITNYSISIDETYII